MPAKDTNCRPSKSRRPGAGGVRRRASSASEMIRWRPSQDAADFESSTDASRSSSPGNSDSGNPCCTHLPMSILNAEILLAFKAGRAFRREGTNTVQPSPTKGAIYLTNGEDGLLHFIWKNRVTNTIEEVSGDTCPISITA